MLESTLSNTIPTELNQHLHIALPKRGSMRGSVASLIIIFLCMVATVAGERCGKDYGGRQCSTRFCCSQYGWCDITADHCSPQKNCQSYCWTSDGGAANVTAKFAYYNPEQINYDLNAAHVACASLDGDKPLKWRSKFGWTAFCGPVGPKGQDACGKCLRLLHTRRNQGVAVYATVRVVDTCGYGAFVLDSAVFNHLDFDGEGRNNGYLQLNYDFIDCEDDASDFFSIA